MAYKYPKTATGTGLASLPIAKRLLAEEADKEGLNITLNLPYGEE
jgi:hypothetical protein